MRKEVNYKFYLGDGDSSISFDGETLIFYDAIQGTSLSYNKTEAEDIYDALSECLNKNVIKQKILEVMSFGKKAQESSNKFVYSEEDDENADAEKESFDSGKSCSNCKLYDPNGKAKSTMCGHCKWNPTDPGSMDSWIDKDTTEDVFMNYRANAYI